MVCDKPLIDEFTRNDTFCLSQVKWNWGDFWISRLYTLGQLEREFGVFSYVYISDLILVLQCYGDRYIEAGHACVDGCFTEFLFLDVEDRQFYGSRNFVQSSLALPIRPAAGMDPAR